MIVYLTNALCSFLAPARKEPKEAVQRDAVSIAPAIEAAPFGNPGPASPLALEHLNLNPVQAENVPIFCLKFGASENGWAEIGTFPPH